MKNTCIHKHSISEKRKPSTSNTRIYKRSRSEKRKPSTSISKDDNLLIKP